MYCWATGGYGGGGGSFLKIFLIPLINPWIWMCCWICYILWFGLRGLDSMWLHRCVLIHCPNVLVLVELSIVSWFSSQREAPTNPFAYFSSKWDTWLKPMVSCRFVLLSILLCSLLSVVTFPFGPWIAETTRQNHTHTSTIYGRVIVYLSKSGHEQLPSSHA